MQWLKNLMRMSSIRSPQPCVLERLARIPRTERPSIRVLDLPAGNGVLTIPLQMAGFDTTGCDLFPEYAQENLVRFRTDGVGRVFRDSCKGFIPPECRSMLFGDGFPSVPDRLSVVPADMEEPLPFENGAFDIVTCVEGIEHIDGQFKLLRELRRVVKTGGTLIITTPNPLCVRTRVSYALTGQRTFKTFIDEYTEVKDISADGKRMYHGHVFLIDYHELRYLLHHAGFRIRGLLPFPPSFTSLALAPLFVPLMFAASRGGRAKGRRKFAKLMWDGKIPPDTAPPYSEIDRHIFSSELLLGSVQLIEAEAV